MLFENLVGDGSAPASSGTLPAFFAIFTVLPLLVLMASGTAVAVPPEFTVHRVQHFDFPSGSPRGCRNNLFNLEARTFNHVAGENVARKCVIVRLLDLLKNTELIDDLTTPTAAGALLVLLPEQSTLPQLSASDVEALLQVEKVLLQESIQTPVYFVEETTQVTNVYNAVEESWQASRSNESVLDQFLSTITSNAFQLVVTGSQAVPFKDPIFTNIEVTTIILCPSDCIET